MGAVTRPVATRAHDFVRAANTARKLPWEPPALPTVPGVCDSAAVDLRSATEPEPRCTSPPRADAGTAASPIEVGSDSDDPRPLVVAEADVEPKSPTKGVSALDTLFDLAVTQLRSTVHLDFWFLRQDWRR